MGALNYSGQYLHGHEFRIKTRIGANVSGATGDAIAGELLFETGDNGAGSVTGVLYGATTTTSGSSPATIVRIGPSEGGGGGTPGGSDTNVQFNEWGSFGGSDYLIYDYNSEFISGASGIFDYFSGHTGYFRDYASGATGEWDFTTGSTGHWEEEVIVGTGDNLFRAQNELVEISGELRGSGEVWITGSDGQFCQVECGGGEAGGNDHATEAFVMFTR